jgi:hypothetical protein
MVTETASRVFQPEVGAVTATVPSPKPATATPRRLHHVSQSDSGQDFRSCCAGVHATCRDEVAVQVVLAEVLPPRVKAGQLLGSGSPAVPATPFRKLKRALQILRET